MTPMTASAAAARKSAQSKLSRGIPKKRASIAAARARAHGTPRARSGGSDAGVDAPAASVASRRRLRRRSRCSRGLRRRRGRASTCRSARRAASRWYSRTICIAIGAATVGPEPPCSTRTTTAISGAFAGASTPRTTRGRARGTRPSSGRRRFCGARSRSARCRSCRRRRAIGSRTGYAVPFAAR